MAEHLISYLRNVLADAHDGCVTYQWLSDEETAAIEQEGPSDFTVQPWLEAQQDIDPSVGARFGERSLFLRGLLEASVDEQTGQPSLSLGEELRLVADARRLGVGYILSRATYDGVRTARNNVLQSQIGSFEEEIDDEGIHLFSACTYRAAVHRLAAWALPLTDHAGAEMRTRISADQWPKWVMNELGVDVRAVEVDIFLPGASGGLGSERWLVAHGFEAAVIAVPVEESLHVASMTTSRLEARLADRISAGLGVVV